MKQFKSYKKTEIPLYEHCTPNSFQCAKITLLSNCTPSPLTRRGQGEVEMAHKYAFSVQKCAMVLPTPFRHCEDEGRSPSERSIRAGKLKVVYSEIASSSACAGFIAMTFSVQKCAMG